MKQVIQSFKTGELTVSDVPPPLLHPKGMLVHNGASLVSAGTERMVVDFAEKNLLQKARARPDLVRQVLDKIQREGLLSTFKSVQNRLEQALPLGCSSAGVVMDVGAKVQGFSVGDRVACAGGGYASHAEIVYIPRNLAVKLPDHVSFEVGAFATLGAIALQGVRQADVVLGHKVAVIGLGLIGQLTVQLLKAAGCQTFGVDLNAQRVELALKMGADAACINEEASAKGAAFTDRQGFDAVIITAETKSGEPVELAGELARDRGIVVAVGAVGMTIPRKVYYEKELDFRLSRSYGPGRYDPAYEEKGQDYPYGYVRWTEQRNLETFVQLVSAGALKIDPLITHQFKIDEAINAYDVITGKTEDAFLGVLLTYDIERSLPTRVDLPLSSVEALQPSSIRLGVVGAGNFASATLLPAIQQVDGVTLVGIVSGSGTSARQQGERFGLAYCASAMDELLADDSINWLAILTRHNLHAQQAIGGMLSNKHVFVEKPLAVNYTELVEVMRVQRQTQRQIMVGFNRRFAPMVKQMRRFFSKRVLPLVGICRVNAGFTPANHWTQDPEVGGGRIIGEAIHFIDLLQFLTGAPPTCVHAVAAHAQQQMVDDEVIITTTFGDGSIGTVIYTAGGDKTFGKERVEVFGEGRVAVLDDYRRLELVHNGKRKRIRGGFRPSKGHREEWVALADAVRRGATMPITVDEIVSAHLATFAAVESLRRGKPVSVDKDTFGADVDRECLPT